ncbi:MAG: glycoside hydrolase family 5 [Cyanobacteria bacterium RYN_339]|nr:glycoside hydrolase family 5 [Cyanobacteria bacterium RYN_339]
MLRLATLAAALVLVLPLPAEARLGDTLVTCKRFCDQPGVHHVRVALDQGKVVQESWWLDLEETETWKLDRIRTLRGAIASPRKLVKEWRAGTGIDDNLLADYDDAVRAGVFFVGEGQAQTISFVSPFFNPEAADGYRDVTIEVADNRSRRPRRAAFERRLAHLATLTDDLAESVPAGTTAVRLAIPWARFAAAADPYTLDAAALAGVDAAIARLRRRGFAVVLSYAADEALGADPAAARKRFMATWSQLGKHFGEAGPDLAFELYHRPAGKLAEAATWASLCEDALAELRYGSTDAPVLVAPATGGLPALQLPPDDGLLVAVPTADAAATAWAAANDARVVALP